MSNNNYSAIPAELKALHAWVCWRLEDIGASKPTKVPYDAKTGKLAATNDPESWCTFEQAVAASINYNGIGLVFTDDDPYTFLAGDGLRLPHNVDNLICVLGVVRKVERPSHDEQRHVLDAIVFTESHHAPFCQFLALGGHIDD